MRWPTSRLAASSCAKRSPLGDTAKMPLTVMTSSCGGNQVMLEIFHSLKSIGRKLYMVQWSMGTE